MEWTDKPSLDDEPMDQVHQGFIALLASAQQADDATLPVRWYEALEHTQMHFGMEDEWMRSTGFSTAQNHMLQHRVVLNLLCEGITMARAGQFEPVREMADELAVWFTKHTQSMDAAPAMHMRREPHLLANAA